MTLTIGHINVFKRAMLWMFVLITGAQAVAQTTVTLNADGPGDTYELINSVLAPGYTAVEHPECSTGHPSFGRHIAEVLDATLNKNVFEFYSHVAEDNDRCISFDRQRVEIKTYDQSPPHLIGTTGETVTYKWQFRLADGFQPSSNFTHIHQVKAVGGDEANPLFTLTARKGTPNKMELIYVGTDNVTNKVAIVNLSLFTGVWVEATETVNIGSNGTYSMLVKRISDGATLLSYSNNNIATIRPTNDFIRPKWGIYRSLNNMADLRDDTIRFGTITIEENNVVLPVQLLAFTAVEEEHGVRLQWATGSEINHRSFGVERSSDGAGFTALHLPITANNGATEKSYSALDAKPLTGKNFYRLKILDGSGGITYSPVQRVTLSKTAHRINIFPNPVTSKINIELPQSAEKIFVQLRNAAGKTVLSLASAGNTISNMVSAQWYQIPPGLYFITVYNSQFNYQSKFLKQ